MNAWGLWVAWRPKVWVRYDSKQPQCLHEWVDLCPLVMPRFPCYDSWTRNTWLYSFYVIFHSCHYFSASVGNHFAVFFMCFPHAAHGQVIRSFRVISCDCFTPTLPTCIFQTLKSFMAIEIYVNKCSLSSALLMHLQVTGACTQTVMPEGINLSFRILTHNITLLFKVHIEVNDLN